MGYQALYRRFRPKTFDEVLGQEHVTTILKNQILHDNIAHAYLFSGTRGTGKTSTAKIFARAVNCVDNEDGNPCNQCEVCEKILDDSIMDVVEMDAASNNSVDDIRELREKVKYPPSKGRYKVYIIDEVHMLSKGAFNALLKTLEEPPNHLLFILATTEPQKIPATILSRCQRFDFKRVTHGDIIKNMQAICDELGVEVEDRGLQVIARNSDGAMRDALSILDQCISFADGEITYDYVLSILGTVNYDFVFDIADDIIDKNLDSTLKQIDAIVQKGKDVHQFIKDLILHFRNVMIAKSSTDIEGIIDGTQEMIDRLREQAKRKDLSELVNIIRILSEAEGQSKWSSQPRIILETSMIKLIASKGDDSVEGLLQRIDALESKLASGNIAVKQVPASKVQNTTVKAKSQPKAMEPNQGQQATSSPAKPTATTPTVQLKDGDLEDLNKHWADVMKKIKKEKISLHALLLEGKPARLQNDLLTIVFPEPFGFHRDAVDKKNNKEYIEQIINGYLGTNLSIKFVMEGEVEESHGEQEAQSNTDDQILIDSAKDLFGENLVELEE